MKSCDMYSCCDREDIRMLKQFNLKKTAVGIVVAGIYMIGMCIVMYNAYNVGGIHEYLSIMLAAFVLYIAMMSVYSMVLLYYRRKIVAYASEIIKKKGNNTDG